MTKEGPYSTAEAHRRIDDIHKRVEALENWKRGTVDVLKQMVADMKSAGISGASTTPTEDSPAYAKTPIFVVEEGDGFTIRGCIGGITVERV